MRLGVGRVILLGLTLIACQGTPPPRPVAQTPAALAVEALDKGDYARAADLYRQALATEPESLPIHYGLGIAASYLDQKAEAIREFTWVLARAAGDSPEATTARRWLDSVGARPRPAVAAAASQAPVERSDASPREEEKPTPAIVRGRVLFDDTPGVIAPEKRMQLLLSDYPKREVYLRVRTDAEGQFRFEGVPPGIYKLTDRVAGPPRWRLRVELKPGQELILDLDPANSTRVRDDFPDPTPAAESPSS
jgi:tetratricopeptide (TPR) repeat protein